MVVRPQRRVLAGRSGEPLSAADHGFGLRVRGGQRRGAEPLALVPAQLDEAADRRPPLAARFWPRHVALPLSGKPESHRLSARIRRRDHPVRRQPVPLAAGGRARSVGISRPAAGRAARAQRLSGDRRASLSADPARAQLFLVRPDADRSRHRQPAILAAGIRHPGDAAWLGRSAAPATTASSSKAK